MYFVFLYLHEMFKIGKSLETGSKLVVARAQKRGELGVDADGCGMTKILQNFGFNCTTPNT